MELLEVHQKVLEEFLVVHEEAEGLLQALNFGAILALDA